MKRNLECVPVIDADTGWSWECPRCGKKMIEDDPLQDGDILTCERCGREFKAE